GRLREAAAAHVVQPAVIRAADRVAFDAAVVERQRAVRAAKLRERRLAAGAAEQQQLLAQRLDALRLGRDVLAEAPGLPGAPEQLAHRRARPDAGEQRVVFRAEHGYSAAG